MDVQDMLDEIDLAGFDDLEESDKLAYINRTLKDITNREPWAFREISEDIDAATDIDAEGAVDYSALAYGFGALMQVLNTDRDGSAIKYIRRERLYSAYSGSLDQTGTPNLYYFVGKQLHLFPAPSSGTYRVVYLAKQVDVVASDTAADILLPEDHHEAVLYGVLFRLNAREDDPENAAMFKSLHDERMQTMRQDLEKVQWESPDSILTYEDDHDGYYES